jgi:hypothetical protein
MMLYGIVELLMYFLGHKWIVDDFAMYFPLWPSWFCTSRCQCLLVALPGWITPANSPSSLILPFFRVGFKHGRC